ncbi:MAG: glutamine-hydrolyzing GMP synthase [Planctomycetota bacterium]
MKKKPRHSRKRPGAGEARSAGVSPVESQLACAGGPDELVAILDFGSQYTQLIARRVRELGEYSEIVRHDIPAPRLAARRPKAIILSGGPASVPANGSPRCDKAIFKLGVPVLGICYGMQLMAHTLGGRVSGADKREYGHAFVNAAKSSRIFAGLGKKFAVWMSHGDRVEKLPRGFEVIGQSHGSPVAAMRDRSCELYGLQFHPEVVHTPKGTTILRNFLFKIAKCRGKWSMASFVETAVAEIRERVGEDRVLCGMSGGVDSSVLACLLHRAIGGRLECVFVNNGLLRKDEHREVADTFKKSIGLNLKYVNASSEFLTRLRGVTSPERKRRIIGATFVRVFERAVKGLGEFKYLAQGTLYPDVVESNSAFGGPSAVIKTHHNVGGLPERMTFELIEPFRHLFKDEVRRVGGELELPDKVIWRHPFPGPGLAVRVIGPVTPRKLRLLREADAIFIEELRAAKLYRKIWQAFAVLLSGKAVGVMGDERTYSNVIGLRAVTSRDGMTADWARIPQKVLARIANRIINEVKGVNRVVYDVSSKPPSTIEWE